jgi:p-aminobenzoyl-glutamate transporter AbgT
VTSAEPVILILSGRLGRFWFLKCANVSFLAFFSITKIGQILALKGSPLAGIVMSREEK